MKVSAEAHSRAMCWIKMKPFSKQAVKRGGGEAHVLNCHPHRHKEMLAEWEIGSFLKRMPWRELLGAKNSTLLTKGEGGGGYPPLTSYQRTGLDGNYVHNLMHVSHSLKNTGCWLAHTWESNLEGWGLGKQPHSQSFPGQMGFPMDQVRWEWGGRNRCGFAQPLCKMTSRLAEGPPQKRTGGGR